MAEALYAFSLPCDDTVQDPLVESSTSGDIQPPEIWTRPSLHDGLDEDGETVNPKTLDSHVENAESSPSLFLISKTEGMQVWVDSSMVRLRAVKQISKRLLICQYARSCC